MTALERIEVPSEAEVEAFVMRMVSAYSGGALSLMAAIGHRLGIFDVMAGMALATSEAIAREAGLAERYVREWLAVLVTSGVVAQDPEGRTYALPAAYAAVLTRAAGSMNLASTAQLVTSSAALEDE